MDPFTNLIRSLLIRGQLSPKYINILLNNMRLYRQAFTSPSYDDNNNYEMYEQLGDATANKFLVWYFYRRFPQLATSKGIKLIARLKTTYMSKTTFARIADSLGFWPFIRASVQHKETERKSLLEDVFEAFIGVTETIIDNHFQTGIGYVIVQRILTDIFDKIDISLKYEDLYDPKSILKELFDFYKELGSLEYDYDQDTKEAKIYSKKENKQKVLIARAIGNLKPEAQQIASQIALDLLAKQGYKREVDYSMFYQ